MRYTSTDAAGLLKSANEFLLNSDDKLHVDFKYQSISIYTVNVVSGARVVMVGYVSRGEACRWLRGFIAGMKVINNIEFEDDPPMCL